MRIKVRTIMWNKLYQRTIGRLRGDGMNLVKCRHNGTSAADKTFHLIDDNTLQWNTGMFSKMKQGIQLNFTTDVRYYLFLYYLFFVNFCEF